MHTARGSSSLFGAPAAPSTAAGRLFAEILDVAGSVSGTAPAAFGRGNLFGAPAAPRTVAVGLFAGMPGARGSLAGTVPTATGSGSLFGAPAAAHVLSAAAAELFGGTPGTAGNLPCIALSASSSGCLFVAISVVRAKLCNQSQGISFLPVVRNRGPFWGKVDRSQGALFTYRVSWPGCAIKAERSLFAECQTQWGGSC